MKPNGIVDGFYHPKTKKPIDLIIPFAYYTGNKILTDETKKHLPNFGPGTVIDFRVLIVETLEGGHVQGYYTSIKETFE